MVAEFTMLREASAIAKRMDVEDIPDWQVKTTLQRTVQALTRHRDLYFADAPKDRPASIINTTLAAMAYHGGGSLFAVLLDVVEGMPSFIEERAGILWIPNRRLKAEPLMRLLVVVDLSPPAAKPEFRAIVSPPSRGCEKRHSR